MDSEQSPVELTLRGCDEIVGPFRGMRVDGDFLHIGVHDRVLVYPLGADQAKVIQDALRDVQLDTRVGILCLVIDGRSRLFVRIEES